MQCVSLYVRASAITLSIRLSNPLSFLRTHTHTPLIPTTTASICLSNPLFSLQTTNSFAARVGNELGLSHAEVEALARSVTAQLVEHAAAHPAVLELHYGPHEVDPGE